MNKRLVNKITNPKMEERELVAQLPANVKEAAIKHGGLLQLDSDKVSVFHYKKDDWQVWANPMIYAILDDVLMLDKMKLADLAALDGAISSVRLWRLGNLEHRIMPNKAALAKLAEILKSNVGGGCMDLVWGPDIDFVESNSQVYRFLGSEKYSSSLNSIYAGLGIPPTLTGTATAAGFTNNFISLKTLVERLQYVRDILTVFWNHEIELVRRARGFKKPAELHFDKMSMADEAAEKALLLRLAEMDYVSWETIVERFGESPNIERSRLRKNSKDREKGTLPQKAGPYHTAQQDFELKKGFVSGGGVTPSEVGLELKPRKPGETSMMEMKAKQAAEKAKTAGRSGQGRPKNSKDSTKRKKKRVMPRTSAELQNWYEDGYEIAVKVVEPILCFHLEVDVYTEMSGDDFVAAEHLCNNIMMNIDPFHDVTEERILAVLYDPKFTITSASFEDYKDQWSYALRNIVESVS